jgi:SynChlorMet cassette radical SAM/SPASM protein ScmF
MMIYFYLTEGCNLACRHCWLAPKFDPTGTRCAMLSLEAFETAILEAKPLGLTGVKLTGGEPLLHPQFTRFLEIVQREEVELVIETNGVLCTPEIARKIAECPQRFVSVSFDGADAATHDAIRGVPGSFAKAQDAVRNLAAVDTPPQIIMSLMRSNLHQVEAMVRMAEDLRASSVKFNIIQPTARGEKLLQEPDAPGVQELIKLGRHVESELAQRTSIPLVFDYPSAFRSIGKLQAGDGCAILDIIGVIPSGYYALCGIGVSMPELVFGQAGKDSLRDIWEKNEVLTQLREGLPARLSGVCADCLMQASCLGSCVAQNYYRTGSLWGAYWFCEEAFNQGLFPESRLKIIAAEISVRQRTSAVN